MNLYATPFESRLVSLGRISLAILIGLSIQMTVRGQENSEYFSVPAITPNDDPPKLDMLGDPLPSGALLRLGTNRFCPSSSGDLVLSADDKIVVSVSGRELAAWDASSGKKLWSNPGEFRTFGGNSAAYGLRRICSLPKSNSFATSSKPGEIRICKFTDGSSTSLAVETKHPIRSIDVSPDEKRFALGTSNTLIVCEQSGKEVFRVKRGRPAVRLKFNMDRLVTDNGFCYARFSTDGTFLALVTSEKPQVIQLLDAQTGHAIREIETPGRIVRMDFSPNGKHIATTQRDITARVYDLETAKLEWENVFSIAGMDERYTTDIQYSPAGEMLAIGTAIGEDQRIQLLDAKTGKAVGALTGHTWKPWSLQFTRDGKQMYSCGWDSVIRRWDIEKREQIRIENSERASSVCAIAPNGRTITFCDDSGKVHIVDSTTGKKIKSLEFPGAGNAQVAYSQDSKLLAGGGSSENDLHLYVWDLKTYEVKHHWEWPKGRDTHSSFEALSFSRDANRLGAAIFRQSACYVFDLPSDKQILKTRHASVYGMCLSPDGNQFVSGGWDKNLRLWDIETGENIKTVEVGADAAKQNGRGPDTRMYGALFSPDGKSIATVGMRSDLRVWDGELRQLENFKMKSGVTFGSFQFSNSGLWVVVGHSGGSVAIYDFRTGKAVWTKIGHKVTLYNVGFGADDRTLLTGAGDGVCYLWDLKQPTKSDSIDFEDLAAQLFQPDPKIAFVAYQRLAADPTAAVAAIASTMESKFNSFDSPDEASKLIELNHQVKRAAMLLAQMELPAAGELLKQLVESSPHLSFKKTLFLAIRHRQRFLKRVSSKSNTQSTNAGDDEKGIDMN